MRLRLAFVFVVGAVPLEAQGRLTGTVFDSLITNRPLPQATVMVVGTGVSQVTDARGRFHLDSVPVGRRQVTFFHAVLDSVGVGAGIWDVEITPGGEAHARLITPSGPTLRRSLCPDIADSSSTGVLMGRVRDVDRQTPLTGARVTTNWMELLFGPAGPASERHEASAVSVSSGAFALCGLPLDVPVFIRASHGDQSSGPVEVFANSRPVVFQNLSISLTDSVARVSVDSALNAATVDQPARPPGSATLNGRVRDDGGRPVQGARIALHGGGGVAVADREGAFRMPGLPAGTQTLDIRAIGFAPARRAIDLASNASTAVEWELDRRAVGLPTVKVLGGSRLERNGFMSRERQGLGSFLNEAQIARMGGAMAMDVIQRAPGLMPSFRTVGGGRVIRVVTMRKSGGDRCVPNLYVDGGPWMDGWEQFGNFLMKADVVAVEVYSSTITVPPQFDRHNGCGAVVIWTRP